MALLLFPSTLLCLLNIFVNIKKSHIKRNWQKCEQNENLLPSSGNVKCYEYFAKQYDISLSGQYGIII